MILPHTEVLLMVDSNLKKLIISASLIIFSTSQIIAYFVIRTIVDGLLGNDMKVSNNSAQHLFKCGHVQEIEVGIVNICICTLKPSAFLK